MKLESVKAGDELLISSHFMRDDYLAKVDRVTKTQVIIGNNRYRISDGKQVGSDSLWNVPKATIPTPDIRESVRIARSKNFLIEKLKSKELTALQVDAMISAITKGDGNDQA